MHALVVMHRRTLYENVDSAKIKVPFYTTDIYILRVASMHRIGIISVYYVNLFIIIINKCIIIYFVIIIMLTLLITSYHYYCKSIKYVNKHYY